MGVILMSDRDRDQDKDARELLAMLGMTPEQIDAALAGTLQVQEEVKPVKLKRRVYKEYVLARKAICKTCSTKEVFYFYMTQPIETSGLISQPITKQEFEQATLPAYHDWFKPCTCKHCIDNLILLTKEDLVNMLLKAINDGERK